MLVFFLSALASIEALDFLSMNHCLEATPTLDTLTNKNWARIGVWFPSPAQDHVTHLTVESCVAGGVYDFDMPPTPFSRLVGLTLCGLGECKWSSPYPPSNQLAHFTQTSFSNATTLVTFVLGPGEHRIRSAEVALFPFPHTKFMSEKTRHVLVTNEHRRKSQGWLKAGLAAIKRKQESRQKDLEERQSAHARIAALYQPQAVGLREFSLDLLWPEMKEALNSFWDHGETQPLLALVKPVPGAHGLYKVPVFPPSTRQLFLDEFENANSKDLDFTRPNTMNNYGLVLAELGMSNFVKGFVNYLVAALTHLLLPDYGEDQRFEETHAFSIRYRVGEDESLERHMDQSAVTLNVCLGTEFTGGGVVFEGQRDNSKSTNEHVVVESEPGWGLFHAGQHWHGAERLTSGDRQNVVFWARSKSMHMSAWEKGEAACHHARELRHVEL